MDRAEIFVQDPLTIGDVRNVERGCYQWQNVQRAFRHLRRSLFLRVTVHKDLRCTSDVQRMLLAAVLRLHARVAGRAAGASRCLALNISAQRKTSVPSWALLAGWAASDGLAVESNQTDHLYR